MRVGLPHQINFLIDEAGDYGKGVNLVVSMLHYFFLNTTALAKKKSSCMQITAWVKIRIIVCYSISCGGA